MGVASLSVVGLLEPMAAGLAVSPGLIAFLVTFFALAYGLAAPGFQMIVGHLDRRRLILAGLITLAAACFLAALSTTYFAVSASRVLMALGAALVGPMVSAAAASLVAPQVRGRALGTAFAGLTLATVFGVPVTTFAGEVIGWRMTMGLVGVVALASALWVYLVLPIAEGGHRVSLRDFARVLSSPVLAPAVGITFFQMAAQFATYSLVPVLLVREYGVPLEWVAVVLFLYGSGGVVGNIVATALVDRLGSDRMILISLCSLSAVFLVLSLFDFDPYLGSGMLFVWSFFGLMLFAPQQMRLVSLDPAQQNLLLALNSSAIYLGMAAGAAVAGTVFESFGIEPLTLVSLAISLLAITAFLMSRAFARRAATDVER